MLVAPWVAAEMTDLLQSAVLTGTGRAAQIGRPVAGKTGTTSSNKDGWFIGFSSGLTTGVWMGRDDARPVGNLQGGTAPARAFHDFMTVAVAKRHPLRATAEAAVAIRPRWADSWAASSAASCADHPHGEQQKARAEPGLFQLAALAQSTSPPPCAAPR